MKISSFDIFDTCLVRKCGTPENMLDVLSLRVFKGMVDERVRQTFVVERHNAEARQWKNNSHVSLLDIYQDMQFTHPLIYPIEKLVAIETQLENELLVPVLEMRDKIDAIREKGHRIIYISDMYLPYDFIYKKMNQYGFIKDGDSFYVSNAVGARKSDGELFKYIHEREQLKYAQWHHYVDDEHNDFTIPRKLGIHANLIHHVYNPYPKHWQRNDYTIGFKYKSIIAGLSKALSLSNNVNTHRDFVLDIIAPLYCSWVYEVLKQANEQQYQRLYFLARDAHMIYHIALQMHHLFPDLELRYLYISRKSLYEGNQEYRLKYFEQEGLATTDAKVAIVDTTTGGTTMKVLNAELEAYGYKKVGCFYYQLWNKIEDANPLDFQSMLYDDYVKLNTNNVRLFEHYFIYENFFSLNDEKKTIDYTFKNGIAKPVYSDVNDCLDVEIENKSMWATIHESLLEQYALSFIQLGLHRCAESIFENIAMPTLIQFMTWPEKHYLDPLCDFYSNFEIFKELTPCIRKQPLWKVLLKTKKDRKYYWRRGVVVLNTPTWLLRIIQYIKKQQ